MAAISTKQLLQRLIDDLPDDCTLEDVQYRLYVLAAVERGRADHEAGRTHRHEDVVAELGRRWGKSQDP